MKKLVLCFSILMNLTSTPVLADDLDIEAAALQNDDSFSQVAGCVIGGGFGAGAAYLTYQVLRGGLRQNKAVALIAKLAPQSRARFDRLDLLHSYITGGKNLSSYAAMSAGLLGMTLLIPCGYTSVQAQEILDNPAQALERDPLFRTLSEDAGTDGALRMVKARANGQNASALLEIAEDLAKGKSGSSIPPSSFE